ncbi:MAG TPA: DUF4279 domain-containing protein, partial [Vicinamibacterales bacterium]|nr:DUF4279 domain-containing protein [Vicinamibacterales bacterium]
MKVRQYVCLSVHSHDLVPEQIDRELGLTADESYARGSKRAEPRAVPPYHVWKLFSGVADTRPINDHFTAL